MLMVLMFSSFPVLLLGLSALLLQFLMRVGV